MEYNIELDLKELFNGVADILKSEGKDLLDSFTPEQRTMFSETMKELAENKFKLEFAKTTEEQRGYSEELEKLELRLRSLTRTGIYQLNNAAARIIEKVGILAINTAIGILQNQTIKL